MFNLKDHSHGGLEEQMDGPHVKTSTTLKRLSMQERLNDVMILSLKKWRG
jgi:hypothetical protein